MPGRQATARPSAPPGRRGPGALRPCAAQHIAFGGPAVAMPCDGRGAPRQGPFAMTEHQSQRSHPLGTRARGALAAAGLLLLPLLASVLPGAAARAEDSLPAVGAAPGTTVSGISSGAFMA